MRHTSPAVAQVVRSLAVSGGFLLLGCGVRSHHTRIADSPGPVDIQVEPAILRPGQEARLVVRSPAADSITIVSENGVDRYWSPGPRLAASLRADFGDSVPVRRYAERRHGILLDRLKRPATISVCRLGHCRDLYHEFEVRLPERNERSVAVTGGWSTVFARRSITGRDRTAIFEEALSEGVFTLEGELAARSWSAKAQGFFGPDGHGASLDLSRVLKHGDEISYGIAVNVGVVRNEWLPDGTRPARSDRTAYRVSVGPSIMLRGVTASTQVGIYTSGRETLQVIGTRISANGRLTAVRIPVSLTAERTQASGRGAIVSRRREALERLSAAVHLVDDFAVTVGLSSHRIAWPSDQPLGDLRASEVLITLGAQYALTW